MTSPRGLHALARLHGIQTAYRNHAGERVVAGPETLMAALRALGEPVREASDVGAALERGRRNAWERALEPVVVAWLDEEASFILRLPVSLRDAAVRITVALEEGDERTLETEVGSLEVEGRGEPGGRERVALRAPLPRTPAGYHDLWVEVGSGAGRRRHGALLIAAPRRCAGWETLPGSGWGVFAPLYALWEEARPEAVPHFGLLDRLAAEVAELGGSVVGTLPLLASFLDRPYEPSPYSPVSRLFWNELYVAAPEAELGRHGLGPDGRRMESRAAMAARRRGLEAASKEFYDERGAGEDVDDTGGRGLRVPDAMAAFVARNPRAPDYARFRALTEFHGAWTGWPDRLRARDVRPGDFDLDVARYHLFAQWRAEEELARAAERAEARGVGLYLDLPLGVHPDGYDVWRERDQFVEGATAGAPPDPLAPQGQDWGFHPPHPAASRSDGHRYFVAAIRNHLRFGRVLRVDHVMQLHRMFWVLGSAAEGVYVRYPHEELYAILSLESHRAGSVVVGEDLGTVPRAVRRAMRGHGMPGTYVVQFSLEEVEHVEHVEHVDRRSGALVPGRVPAGSLAGIGTHDTPTFAAWWTGRDAEIRAERGLMSREEAEAEVRGREALREKLARGLGVEVRAEAVQEGLLRFLGRSRAGLVLAAVEDLWMETEPQNVPGTPARENWRQRARHPVESITGDAARLLTALNEAREGRP